jgi:cation diffusion facilitator family transporter
MHQHETSLGEHDHRFTTGSPIGEQRTLIVTGLTAVMMVLEIVAGRFFNSMALFADGWHMGTHVVALGISALAYVFSRRHAEDDRFTFGPGKIGPLGAYSSALILAGVAIFIFVEAGTRLLHPTPIQYTEAMVVAALGLVVNLTSAWLLRDSEHHHHHGLEHGHAHEENHHRHHRTGKAGHDVNLRAAYLHVLADAATSLAALVALSLGKFVGLGWLDPAVGIAGSVVVGQWAYSLIRDSSRILLDREMNPESVAEIREAIQNDGDSRVTDLHLLRVGLNEFAVVVAIVTDNLNRTPEEYRSRLRQHQELVHITVEVNRARSAGASRIANSR